jgi:hypothetical protein
MIIFIDSNVFIADPHCKGIAWHVLAHAAPAWGLRMATTEVVVAEVLSKYERLVDAWQKDLAKQSRSLAQFGLDQVFADQLAMIAAARDVYPDAFRKALESYDVEIVKIPSIPHMDLVERATSRRRPCDDNGNGYRDTLNWLILLRTAEDNPDELIAWISNDTDFMAPGDPDFHADLVDDLMAINAADRVSLFRGLKDLILELAAKESVSAGDDLQAVADQLQRNSIKNYLTVEIIPAALNVSLDVYRCGLPFGTKSARLLGVTDMSDVEVDLTGSISGDQVLARFTLTAIATIDIIDGPEVSESDTSPTPDELLDAATTSKTLFFRGIITLDSHGKPLTAELSTIEAAHDDLGRRKWDEALGVSKLLGSYAAALRGWSIPEDYLTAMMPKVPPDLLTAMMPKVPPDLLTAMMPKVPPDLFTAMMPKLPPDLFTATMPKLPPDLFTATMPKLPPDLFTATMPKLPPDYFKGFTPSESFDDENDNSQDDDDDSAESD